MHLKAKKKSTGTNWYKNAILEEKEIIYLFT